MTLLFLVFSAGIVYGLVIAWAARRITQFGMEGRTNARIMQLAHEFNRHLRR